MSLRTLYVDDEEALLDVCKEFLEMSEEIVVETATSADEALRMMSECSYDAIVSDYQMPEKNGITFLKEIRIKDDHIPFILFTGRGREEVAIEALNSGADFYLQKGGDPRSQFGELEYKIKEAVRRNRAETALKLNEERLKRAQTIGEIGCWEFMWNAAGNKFWGSDECFLIFGLPQTNDGIITEELLEEVIVEKKRVHKERHDVIKNGKEYDIEYEIAPANGGPHKSIHSVAKLERNADGQPTKMIGIIQDITKYREFETRLQKLNRKLMAINECDRALVKAETEQELLDEICRIVCEVAGYRMAWIGMAEHDVSRSVRPVAWSGHDRGYVIQIKATWNDDERGRGPTGVSIKTGKTVFVQDYETDERIALWREFARHNGYRSSIAIPLMKSGSAFGTFMLYSEKINGFTEDEVALLEGLTRDLAFGIIALRAQKGKRKAEEALKKSEERFEMAFEVATNGMILLGLNGKYLAVNRAFCDMLGYTKEELLHRSYCSITHPDDVEKNKEWVRKMMEGEEIPHQYEKRYLSKDGRIVWAALSASLFRDREGRPLYLVGEIKDITEIRLAESEQNG